MLFNLIGNALKFTFKGRIFTRVYMQDNFLITEIEDTGVGISA